MAKNAQIHAEDSIFRENFINTAYVSDNGGTLTAAPAVDNGVTLNGTSQTVTFSNIEDIVIHTSLTFEMWFTPDFDYDDDADIMFFDSTSGRYYIYKDDNAGNNVLTVRLGSATIGSITEGIYSSYWNVGSLNHLVVASNGTTTDVYLNNNLIMDADATAWTPLSTTTFYIGANQGSGWWFDGIVNSFSVYKRKWTAAEVSDAYNRITFDELDASKSLSYLPLRSHYDDSGTEKTADLIASAATWGDGSTTTTYPTQQTPHGIDCDGGDYVQMQDGPNTSGTMMCGFVSEGTGSRIMMGSQTASPNSRCYLSNNAGSFSGGIGTDNFGTIAGGTVVQNTFYTGAITWDGTTVNLYLDGENTYSAGQNGVPSTIDIWVGANSLDAVLNSAWIGKVFQPSLWPVVLTPTQIRAEHNRIRRQLNI